MNKDEKVAFFEGMMFGITFSACAATTIIAWGWAIMDNRKKRLRRKKIMESYRDRV